MKLFPEELKDRIPKSKLIKKVEETKAKENIVKEWRIPSASSLMKIPLVFTYSSRLMYPAVRGQRSQSLYAWKIDMDAPGIDKQEIKLIIDSVEYVLPEGYKNLDRVKNKFPFSISDKG